jgi:hypothetical protein
MDPKDIDSVVKLVKKLLNEVVDMKKNSNEGPFRPINFHPLFKINETHLDHLKLHKFH